MAKAMAPRDEGVYLTTARPKLTATVREWLRHADGEFVVAEREMRAEKPVYHTICFLCHSSAETHIRAFLPNQGWALIESHDLLPLLAECASYDYELSQLQAEGKVLNKYIIVGRYPGDIGVAASGKAEAEVALAAARRIRDRVLELMRK